MGVLAGSGWLSCPLRILPRLDFDQAGQMGGSSPYITLTQDTPEDYCVPIKKDFCISLLLNN